MQFLSSSSRYLLRIDARLLVKYQGVTVKAQSVRLRLSLSVVGHS
nr:MAG TPA: hypothetical protein [Caudoviricetes sp.]